MTVHISKTGVEAIAKSAQIASIAKAAAEKVAENVSGLGIKVGDRDGGPREIPLPVKVTTGTTDRAVAAVLLAHPAGMAVQAKHGALTRAASEAGLTVKGGE